MGLAVLGFMVIIFGGEMKMRTKQMVSNVTCISASSLEPIRICIKSQRCKYMPRSIIRYECDDSSNKIHKTPNSTF